VTVRTVAYFTSDSSASTTAAVTMTISASVGLVAEGTNRDPDKHHNNDDDLFSPTWAGIRLDGHHSSSP